VRLIGAILAGGASSRFGSDKAMALLDGRPLIAHVAAALAAQCETVVVAGRDWAGLVRVDDLPAPGLGPLGGLAGALSYAVAHGHDAVLTSGCDLPRLPHDIAAQLGAPDVLLADQPTVGLWRAEHAGALARFVASDARRSIRGWADAIGARRFAIEVPLANVNRPEDLANIRLS
jgi:molybdopterin-guanine dinucleotide biosynthesis protein A